MTVDQGWYTFYAGLPCGNKSGKFNLNASKDITLTCGEGNGKNSSTGSVGVSMASHAGRSGYCYGIYDYWFYTGWDYAYMGDWCQGHPATAGEQINYDVPRPSWDSIDPPTGYAGYFDSGTDACAPEFGNGFYYDDCN